MQILNGGNFIPYHSQKRSNLVGISEKRQFCFKKYRESITLGKVLPKRFHLIGQTKGRKAKTIYLSPLSTLRAKVLDVILVIHAEKVRALALSFNSGAPNENIVQNHLNIAVLNVF